MFRSSLSGLSLAALLAAGSVACSDDEGTPPTLKDLQLSPTSLDVGKQTTLAGTAMVEDSDGDVSALLAEITLPNGQVQALQQSNLPGASGARAASVQVNVILALPAAGEYTLAIWAKDSQGNESAKLRQTLTAK